MKSADNEQEENGEYSFPKDLPGLIQYIIEKEKEIGEFPLKVLGEIYEILAKSSVVSNLEEFSQKHAMRVIEKATHNKTSNPDMWIGLMDEPETLYEMDPDFLGQGIDALLKRTSGPGSGNRSKEELEIASRALSKLIKIKSIVVLSKNIQGWHTIITGELNKGATDDFLEKGLRFIESEIDRLEPLSYNAADDQLCDLAICVKEMIIEELMRRIDQRTLVKK